MSKRSNPPRIKTSEEKTGFRFQEINDRFRQVRLQRGESQEEFGEHFSIPRTNVSSIERHAQAIPVSVMQQLRWRFKVDLNWLLCGDAPQGTPQELAQKLKAEIDAERKLHEETRASLEECRLNNKALRIAAGLE